MRQRRAGEVIVDKRRLRTNAPEPKPDKDEVLRVLEIHGHNLARLDAQLRLEVMAISEDRIVALRIGEALALKDQQDAVARGFVRRIALEDVEEAEAVGEFAVVHARGAGDGAFEEEEVVPETGASVEVGGGSEEGWGSG